MITTVSLNPSIDLSLFIPKLSQGDSHRAKHSRQDISGKAVNTAYALQNLGVSCRVLGLDFTENGQLLKDSLKKADVTYDYVSAPGAMRTNIKIFEEDQQIMTEINQEGPAVSNDTVEAFLKLAAQDTSDILVLSGSLPQGVESSIYKQIISQTNATVILDAYGEALRLGLEAQPAIIKPNQQELEQTFDVNLPNREEQVAFCRKLINKYNLYAVCLSQGYDGALMIGKDELYFAPALKIPVRGVQGAGDSMVAGLAAELQKNKNAPLDVLLKSAVAMAAASLIREGTLMGLREDYLDMMRKVEIKCQN